MKCKNCNGTGKVRGYFYEKTGVNKWEKVWGDSPCDECNGTGEVEMTEQEYIQTCNTEQLAEVLADISLWISPFMKQKNRFELHKKQFYEWLKQPHTEGVTK